MPDKVQRVFDLLDRRPFRPFTIRCGGQAYEVDYERSVAYHPEVPFLRVYGKHKEWDLSIEHIEAVEFSHHQDQ